MSNHPTLNTAVIIAIVVIFCLVVAYQIIYTRRLKTPRGVGKSEGIAIATEEKEREGKSGSF